MQCGQGLVAVGDIQGVDGQLLMGLAEAGLEAETALRSSGRQQSLAHQDFLVGALGVKYGEVQLQAQILEVLRATGANDRGLTMFN